jgi:uncharacterized membrane protein
MENYTCKQIAEKGAQPTNPKYSLDNLIIMFFIFSFSGWVWEVIYIGFTEGIIAKRGMLHGPWLPIYGVGGILIILFLSRFYPSPPKVFILASLLCGTLEYLTAISIEYLFQCRWWDYSDKFLNLNGRICLEGILLFGITGTIAVCKVGPNLNDAISKLNRELHTILNITLCSAFAVDLIFSMRFPNIGEGITYALLNIH